MNLRLIVIILSILLVPPLIGITLFSVLNTIQPTIAGYSILALMKFSGYIVVPIIYLVSLILLIFKYKVVFDSGTAFCVLFLGLVLLPLIFIILKQFLTPDLYVSDVSGVMGYGGMSETYVTLFRNQIIICVYYLSFTFSIFLSQFSDKALFKILIFVFGGMFLSLILSYLESFIFTLFV